MVLGAVACSSSDALDDAGAADAGQDAGQVIRDAGAAANDASIADAGLADAAVRDSGVNDEDAGIADAGQTGCTYPEGAREPMTLDEVITPYSWAAAIDGANQRIDLDLTQAYCNDDPDIEWSPFDVLLFVSIPAW